MNLILADRMRILIGYVKMNTAKDKLNGYTYITFYLIYNNIKCDTYYDIIVYISILSPYLLSFGFYNNRLHNLRRLMSIWIPRFMSKYSKYLVLLLQESGIFHYYFFTNSNIKIYCLISLKNSLFHTDIIIKHPTFGYRIGYG